MSKSSTRDSESDRCTAAQYGDGMTPLGHSQVSLTLDTYSHVSPTLQAEAAERMNDAIGKDWLSGWLSNRNPQFSRAGKIAKFWNGSGEPPRNRTENPQIKSLLLCQLS